MVNVKYLKGKYSDREIIEMLNSIKGLNSILKTVGEFKSFGKMIQAKITVKDLTQEEVVSLAKNRP